MLILGISSKLTEKLHLFMYEFDNIKPEIVYDEAKYLSQCFDIDIFVLKSSENNYHLISFDVLTKEKVNQIQNYITLESDYIHLCDQKLLIGNKYGTNVLRVATKFDKKAPVFEKVFYAEKPIYQFSIFHFAVWSELTQFPNELIKNYVNGKRKIGLPFQLVFDIYNTGVKRKLYQGGLRRK